MMENATSGSAPTRLLIGLAIDLSASMKQSLRHPTREKMTGDESLRRSLNHLARQAKQVIQAYRTRDGEAFTELFVYGFGLGYLQACDLFSLLEIGAEKFAIDDAYAELEKMAREHDVSPLKVKAAWPVIKANPAAARFVTAKLKIDPQARKRLAELLATSRKPKKMADNVKAYVQELIAHPFEDTTLSIEQVVSLWENSGAMLENVEGLIYGEETPLRDALTKIKARFDRELASRPDDTSAVLLVLSDGIATDGDPLAVIEELKAMGVTVFAGFVTSDETAHPRVLYAEYPRRNILETIQDVKTNCLFTLRHLPNKSLFAFRYLRNQTLLSLRHNWQVVALAFLVFVAFLAAVAAVLLLGVLFVRFNWSLYLFLGSVAFLLTSLLLSRVAHRSRFLETLQARLGGMAFSLFLGMLALFLNLMVVLALAVVIILVLIAPFFILASLVYFYFRLSKEYEWRRSGARLMFDMASRIEDDGAVGLGFLREQGWTIHPGAKLFFQLNQPQILEELAAFSRRWV